MKQKRKKNPKESVTRNKGHFNYRGIKKKKIASHNNFKDKSFSIRREGTPP